MLRRFIKPSSGLLGAARTSVAGAPTIPNRSLYSAESIGLDRFESAQTKVSQLFVKNADQFRTKMNEFVGEKSTNMIFTEDLKNMIHLAQNNDQDIALIVKMLKKFNKQNKELRFGTYVFGPVVMRMFHKLRATDVAVQCFKDPELDGLFDQFMTFQLLLDLLYEEKRYKEVLEIFDLIKEKQVQGIKYPTYSIVIVFAACYKIGTPEAFEYSKKLMSELQSVGHQVMRKASTFAAGLALKNNAPHIALEILSSVQRQNYVTIRNLKVLSLIELGRYEDTIPILRTVLDVDSPTSNKGTFCSEVIERLEDAITKAQKPELQSEFTRVLKFLKENGHVTPDTVDQQLSVDIRALKTSQQPRQNNMLAASFNRNDSNPKGYRQQRNARYSRPGLSDLQ